MNAKARAARLTIRARRNEAKAHRAGLHTLTSHAIRAGVPAEDAAGIGNAIRAKAKTLGVCGQSAIMARKTADGVRPVRGAKRYDRRDISLLLMGYNPRAARFKSAKVLLDAYAA